MINILLTTSPGGQETHERMTEGGTEKEKKADGAISVWEIPSLLSESRRNSKNASLMILSSPTGRLCNDQNTCFHPKTVSNTLIDRCLKDFISHLLLFNLVQLR